MDRFTRWPEAVPIPDMSAESVAKALVDQWISRFGVPARITSDRGRQFDSSIFSELVNVIGATHLRTTPYHPQSNGIIERWHRSFKAAILCHNPAKWVHHLPIILLGLRVAFKPDLRASPAELVYGTTLTIPGEFFQAKHIPDNASNFVSEFRMAMEKLKPTNTFHHSTPQTFISKSLNHSTHVFIRNDSIRPSLTHPYDGPFLVLKRHEKFYTVLTRGRQTNISVDRLKPAFVSNNDLNSTIPNVLAPSSGSQPVPNEQQQVPSDTDLSFTPSDTSQAVSFSPKVLQPKTTSSGRSVTIPLRFR